MPAFSLIGVLEWEDRNLKATQQPWVPHISLVFREMWDTTDVARYAHRVNRESEGKSRGIPHLAKNERDVGHPAFARPPNKMRHRGVSLCASVGYT